VEALIEYHQRELEQHPYLSEMERGTPAFLQHHIFTIWVTINALKSLKSRFQQEELPWRPRPINPLKKLVKKTLSSEEVSFHLEADHRGSFEEFLYLMHENSVSTSAIDQFLEEFDFDYLPAPIKNYVLFHLDLALNGKVEEISAVVFFVKFDFLNKIFTHRHPEVPQSCRLSSFFQRKQYQTKLLENLGWRKICSELWGQNLEKKFRAHNACVQSLEQLKNLWDYATNISTENLSPNLLH
jgi:hypothetical protein